LRYCGFAVLRFGARIQHFDKLFEGALFGGGADFFDFFLLDEPDRRADEVSDHALHIPSHIADFGKFGGLNFNKRRLCQLSKSPGDLGLSHSRGTDHEDVFGQDVVALFLGELLAPVAVAQSDGNRLLGGVLADDVLVELGDGLTGGEVLYWEHVACGL
jgi:hypothetical protein